MAPGTAACIDLRSAQLALRLWPALGACWGSLRHLQDGRAPVDILRPLPEEAADPFASGGFCLLPWSNRLFGGRLLTRPGTADGTGLSIRCNRVGIPQLVHGLGWSRAWEPVHRSPDHVELAYRHIADADWPFDHHATQTVTLAGGVARFEATLHNLSNDPMPAGLGFHPWLAADSASEVAFAAATVWQQDTQGVPLRPQATADVPEFDFHLSRNVASIHLNHCFGAWAGHASLTRPDHGLAVHVHASAALGHLMVYRPRDAGWICIEPVSHATGAWSLPALHAPLHGAVCIEPGARFSAWMELHIRHAPHAAP